MDFHIEETREPDGGLRLRLHGELDLATVPAFSARVREALGEHRAIRLDLSALRFIDSTGLSAVMLAVRDAQARGGELVVNETVSRPVCRVLEVAAVDAVLWPEQPSPGTERE